MPKVLLTGCFGNVGMNAVRHFMRTNRLLQRVDHPQRVHLTCFDKRSELAQANHRVLEEEFSSPGEGFQTVWGDLTDAEGVREAVRGQDAVVHLAALIPPAAYELMDVARRVNVDGTMNLLNACAEQEKPPRFVFASSYSVTGPANPHRNPPIVTPETPLNPQDSYASHKAKCEKAVRAYKGEWSILRIGAVSVSFAQGLGSGNKGKNASAFTYGIPADQRRHGVHSADCGRAFAECAVTKNDVHGKVLMIGGDATWQTTSTGFTNTLLRGIGVGEMPREMYRDPAPDADDCYYYENWMDTTESQALLDFQKHSISDWESELRAEVGTLRYAGIRLVSPLIRYSMIRNSPYYSYNTSGRKHPDAEKPFAALIGNKPEPY